MVAAKTSAATASHFSLAASLSFGFGLFGIAGFCWYFPGMGAPPHPAPPREKRAAPPRPAPPRKKASLAPPRENWQNLRGGAGQSLFESLEN